MANLPIIQSFDDKRSADIMLQGFAKMINKPAKKAKKSKAEIAEGEKFISDFFRTGW